MTLKEHRNRNRFALSRLCVFGSGADGADSSVSLPKIPKRACKSDAGKQRLGLFQRVASPFWFQFVLVPVVSKPPALLRRESRASAYVASPAPTINVLFCTEEEHRASGKTNVVPPTMGWNGEVNNSFASCQLSIRPSRCLAGGLGGHRGGGAVVLARGPGRHNTSPLRADAPHFRLVPG